MTVPTIPVAPRTYTWSYGITTILQRENLLNMTIKSLKGAGFDRPTIFLNGNRYYTCPSDRHSDYKLEVSGRTPKLTPFANWFLGLWELYMRQPMADYYAIFQDDLLICKNVKTYLEKSWSLRGTIPIKKCYINLFTTPNNTKLLSNRQNGTPKPGWYRSNQSGEGAVALVFPGDAAMALLSSRTMLEAPTCSGHRSWKNIDGAVTQAMHAAGFEEWIHYPSLVYHTGKESTLGNTSTSQTDCFCGENYDIMEVLK